MHWSVVAPFINDDFIANEQWLDDWVPGSKYDFTKIPRRDAFGNLNCSSSTSLSEWKAFWNQSVEAKKATLGGIITAFPQLAVTTGLQQRLSSRPIPVIAWSFNVGQCYPGLKQRMSRFALQKIDKFIVHSQQERKVLSQWLGLPQERFEFVPLNRPNISVTEEEETQKPFILAMGSANRDYRTLFQAVEKLKIRTIVVAGEHALSDLKIPPQVEVYSRIKIDECHRLAQKARLNIVPLHDTPVASGQITIIDAMLMKRAMISTKCVGSEDYVQHGKTGWFVQPNNVDDLTHSIEKLWSDSALRSQLAKAAGQYAERHFSDAVAGARLSQIIDNVVEKNSV
ncbi:glycosyltransferase family 4 protein [Lyngbya sp. CCY1209]|uniref:glycosyltransferase family 4 protein n=1 Tax=Lyngbya sp. CCY1209 TaxID=2886103 RepID=UPI002D20FD21|nr:glycosyltransferase family 4 protein [Lyngbya sp. CCY1209]MEB3886880.1 glycosyltransferase family 4 protein [Lyngbya sp. CCY1209]